MTEPLVIISIREKIYIWLFAVKIHVPSEIKQEGGDSLAKLRTTQEQG